MTDTKRILTDEEIGLGNGATTAPSAQKQKVLSDSDIGLSAPEPGFAARLGQGASRALDSAKTALTDDPKKIAQIAAEQSRNALPQTALQRQMADEYAPYVDAANKAEGIVDNVKAWGAAGFKRAGQLLSNPAEAGKMIVEQLPNSAPALAGGFVGAKAGAALGTAVAPGIGTAIGGVVGGIAGGFAGGYGLEKGAAMQEQVQKEAQARKIDLQNEAEVSKMVADKLPEFESAAQRKGIGTAGTDAVLNVATMGLAGLGGRTLAKEARTLADAVKAGTISAADAGETLARLEAANAARNTLGAKALRGTGVVGAEMAGEGLSEAAGQKLAYGKVDAGDVIDESLMGLGSGALMSAGGKAFNKAAGIVDQDATTRNLAAARDQLPSLGPAFTTSPGAADPNAQQQPPATPPKAPDLTTSPGAGVARDGIDSTRDVDTSGLQLQDPAEVERARAATIDYEPGDTTPQWDTELGASPSRDGLNIPPQEPDTGNLGIDAEAQIRAPLERSAAAGGALSPAALTAIDVGATPVQFVGATGRDLQPRPTGPGIGNDSNVIDVQAREVPDQRAISTPGRIETNNQPPAGRQQQASQPLALAAPSNLREGLDRVRQQKQDAANALAAQAQAQEAATAPTAPAAGTGPVEASLSIDQMEDALAKESDATTSAIENDWMNGKGRRRRTIIEWAIYDAITAPTLDADNAAQIVEVALENGRFDLAQYAAMRAMRAAKSMITTPGVSQSSPKYGEIKSDLEARKKQAIDAASALQEIIKSKQTRAGAAQSAGPASTIATTGATSEPTPNQAIQAGAQPAQAGAAQAGQPAAVAPTAAPQPASTWATMPTEARQQAAQAAGLNKPQTAKALATNSVEEMPAAIAAKLAPVLTSAAGDAQQAPVPEFASFEAKTALLRTSPELVDANGNLNERGNKIARTPWGELSQQEREVVVGLSESRRKANDSYNAYVREQEFQAERRRLQGDRIIQQANGKPFKNEAIAKAKIDEFDLADTHAIQKVDGGFVLRQMPPAEQADVRRKAEGRESYMEAQSAVLAEMGIGENADGEIDATDEQFNEIERRIALRLGRNLPANDSNQNQPPAQPQQAQAVEANEKPMQAPQAPGRAADSPAADNKPDPAVRERLMTIAKRLGVAVNTANGGFQAYGGAVDIPAEDVQVEGALSPNHVAAHELGHAAMQKRGVSFQGHPIGKIKEIFIQNWDELVAASKAFRPAVWASDNQRIRNHARKPNEVIADAIGSVYLGLSDVSLLEPMMNGTGTTAFDLGLENAPANSQQVAEGKEQTTSQATSSANKPQQAQAATEDVAQPAQAKAMIEARRVMGDRFEATANDLTEVNGALGNDWGSAYVGTPKVHVAEIVANENLKIAPTDKIERRIQTLNSKRDQIQNKSAARFDPTRLGGRGAAGRERDRHRAAEHAATLKQQADRLQAELDRRAEGQVASQSPANNAQAATENVADTNTQESAAKAQKAAAAQPITRADVEAAQQQAAAIIGERIDAMSAGDVNKIAKKFLPTMGMKPTMSKANNKAAMTDPKINLEAAAAEVGAVLPAEVTRALQADMEGRVVEGEQRPTPQASAVAGAESASQAVATPVDDAPRRADTAATDSRPAQEAPAAEQQKAVQARFGRDNVPLSEGGKPFKTRKAAGDAKKLQPMMRVVTVPGGYALAEKTPAQLAAEERASRRLRNPNTSARGEPIPAHAFIAAAGGLNRVVASDMGVNGNPRIGNRTLFAGQGRGLSMEQATQMLIQEGYLSEGATINDALDLIKKSLTQPQYNADGIERIAQAEADARFDDYLTALEEAAIDGDFDPFGMADDFTADELDEVGYTAADPALQAEVDALTAQADAIGIDTYEILEDIARTYANATQDQYNAAVREAIAQALARGNQDGGSAAAQAAPATEPAAEQGLNQPSAPATLELSAQTPAEAAAQQDAQEQAAKAEAAAKRAADAAAKAEEERKRIAQASVRAADSFELGQDPLDSLTGQGSIFDAPEQAAPAQPDTPKLTQDEAKSLMAWEDLGQKNGVKTHALTFYESQADKDAKRGRMIVARVTKEVDGRNWMVEGTEEMLAVLGMAKKKAEQVGMARVVADGYVEQGEAPEQAAEAQPQAEDNGALIDSISGKAFEPTEGQQKAIDKWKALEQKGEVKLKTFFLMDGDLYVQVENAATGATRVAKLPTAGGMAPASNELMGFAYQSRRRPLVSQAEYDAQKLADAKVRADMDAATQDAATPKVYILDGNDSMHGGKEYIKRGGEWFRELNGNLSKIGARKSDGVLLQVLDSAERYGELRFLRNYEAAAQPKNSQEGIAQARAKRKPKTPEALASQTQAATETVADTKPAPAAKAGRFEIGKSLTKEQRKQVLDSLVDVYKSKGAEREFKGQDGNGNDRYGYAHSPDLFEKSDITGAMVRYYVTLPDGRIAHPTELFPDVSASDIERMALEQEANSKSEKAFENAIKPFYQDFDSANLMTIAGQVVISKGDRFAIIPNRIGAVNQARQQGWELAKPAPADVRRALQADMEGAVADGFVEQGEAPMFSRAQAAADSARLDRQSGDVLFSFAGQQAATADTMALATAKQRLDAGEDAEAVRKDTGWFKGADGKWRFEINDADAKLQDRAQWTRQIDKLRARSDEALKAKWDAEERRNAFLRLRGESPSRISADTKKTPEFKALAKAVKAAEAAAEKARSAVFSAEMGDSLMTVGDVLIHPALFAAYPGVASLKVEINRDLPVGNASYTYETQTIELSEDSDQARMLSTLLHEIQHGIQTVEGFATGGNSEMFASGPMFDQRARNLAADLGENLTGSVNAGPAEISIAAKYGDPNEMGEIARKHGFAAIDEALSFLKSQDEKRTPFGQYRRLAGEVEARNTQARQNLTDAQRRATPPSQTADVADSDVIVVFNGKVAKSAPLPANAAPDAAQQTPRTSAATIRAAISKAYGKLLGQLEAKGLVTLAQTEAQAVEAAAHARAKKTGGDVAQIKRSLTAAMQGDTDLDVKRSANGAVQGFFDPKTGQSFLIADNLTAEAAPGVLMHEVGIHMAADGSMKALFNRAAMMLKAQKADPFMRAVQAKLDAAGETSPEEVSAYLVEAYENQRAQAPASVKRWLADLLATVKAWLYKKGIVGADSLTVADVAAVARANAKSMARDGGADRAGGGDVRFSRASQAINNALNERKTVIAGQTSRAYTPEQQAAMRNVGLMVEQPSLKERTQALWQDAGKKLAQGIVDQFAPVKEISKDAYALLRLSKGASGAFETLLKGGKLKLSGGVYDFDEANKGGVVDALLTPLNGEHHDFLRWVAANRAERLMGEDRERLFTLDDIAALKTLADGQLSFDFTLKNGPRKGKTTRSRAEAYKDSLTTFNAFNKNVLDMAEQSGLIDPDSRATWESEFYVPFYRVADEESGGVRGMNIKGSVVRQQAFKHLKGGKQALNNDLLDNTLMNWAHLLDASAKNRAAKATLEAAQQVGVAIEAPKGTLDNIASAIGKKNGIVWFMDGGQKRHFMVDDPYIMTAISSLEYAGMNSPIMNAMGAFKHALTIGVTASPFFKIRNLIRDSVQVVGTSSIGVNPLKNVADGWKLTDPKNDAYFRLLAGGGTIHFGTMLEGSEAKRVQALVESGVQDSTILNTDHKVKQFYRKYIEPGITAYNELGNRGEAVNRAALYDQLRKQGMGHAEASLQARDLMDFSMQGSFTSIRFLSQVVPFLNARLQGMYKLGRAANENPKRMAYVTGAVAMASLALLAAYGDDDDWKRREDWDRNNFWWFKVGGIAFRIPKPFELGAIGTLAERSAEYLMDDEMTGKRFRGQVLKLLGDNLSMNPIPQAVKPLLDVYANKDSFRNAPIESMGMERMKSEYRFNDRTSMVARGMSTAANSVTGLVGAEALSPVQIDHLLRGYFGWLGTFAVGTADMIARPVTNQPTQATQDIWKKVTGGIASQLEDAPSRYVSSVYDQAKELEQAYGTWRALQKSGKPEEAAAFFADNREEIARYRSVTQVKSAESKLNERIRQIERNEAMDGDQKREEIRRIRAMKEALAKQLAPA